MEHILFKWRLGSSNMDIWTLMNGFFLISFPYFGTNETYNHSDYAWYYREIDLNKFAWEDVQIWCHMDDIQLVSLFWDTVMCVYTI